VTALRSAAVAAWIAAETPAAARAASLTPAALRARAARHLAALLDLAGTTPFYAARLRAAGLPAAGAAAAAGDPVAALAGLAPVTKADLRAAEGGALAGGRPRDLWQTTRSSGSTGEPFRVWYDARGWAVHKHVVKLRARALCGVRPTDRIAVLEAVPAEREGRTLPERTGRVRRFSVFRSGETLAREIAAFRPDAVYGLPSALREAAAPLAALRPPRPRAVFTTGELLDPATRREIAAGFGAPVLDVYGTSETKEIAWSCPAGGLHLNDDVLLVEALDPQGRALPPGAEGGLAVTVLRNRAMPLLRYLTGDRGSLDPGRCACGLPFGLMGVVSGREADHVTLPGGRRLSPYALTCALEAVPGMRRYQVVELGPGRLRVHARVEAASRAGAAGAVRQAVRGAAGPGVEVDVELTDRFPAGPNGKFRVVQAAEQGRPAAEGPSAHTPDGRSPAPARPPATGTMAASPADG
jgi:phenylacetate-CoA ligase